MARSIRADSTEYLSVTIGANVDITADLIEMSFDGGTTWYTAEHVTGGVRLTVGPTGVVVLPAGHVSVLVRIHDYPEIPVLAVGDLYVTT